MRIVTAYNEILPTHKAHDAFLFREVAELAAQGCDVDLLIGSGSQSPVKLHSHYGVSSSLAIHYLPILRKNNFLNVSWNWPFFYATQAFLKKSASAAVLFSVYKQAAYHLKRRLAGLKYLYEVHELAYYPNQTPTQQFEKEKQLLETVDVICVTTKQLQEILRNPPYNIKTRIELLELAVDADPLPCTLPSSPPTITYVGQLYKEQGVQELIEAMRIVPDIHLQIIGGKADEIAKLDPHLPNVHFKGFVLPHQLQEAVANSHAFIAPFHLVGKMPFVAHTKLYAYRAWARPIIAPDCPIVTDHIPEAHTYKNQEELIKLLKQVGHLPIPLSVSSSWHQRIVELKKIIESLR